MSDVPLSPGITVKAEGTFIVLAVPGWPVITMTTDDAFELEANLHMEIEKAGGERNKGQHIIDFAEEEAEE